MNQIFEKVILIVVMRNQINIIVVMRNRINNFVCHRKYTTSYENVSYSCAIVKV